MQATEHKHLGIFFSEDMKWLKHTSYITAKASKVIGQMYRSSIYLNKKQLSNVYLKMVRPLLEYGSFIFDNCNFLEAKKLENVQRRAAVICTGAMRRTETCKIMELLSWPSLETRRKEQKLIMIFKIYKNLTPLYLSENIQCKLKDKNLRHSKNDMIVEPTCRITCYKTSFFPSNIREWNGLHCDVTSISSLSLFKLTLSRHLNAAMVNKTACPMFEFSFGFYGRILTQLKLDLSGLNEHLFVYNIIDNPFCPNCFECIENTMHYFLKCTSYAECRQDLLNVLQSCLVKCQLNNISEKSTIDFILNGFNIENKNVYYLVNKELFAAVKTYMVLTKRFLK